MPPEAHSKTTDGASRLLVVDDDEGIRKAFARLLRGMCDIVLVDCVTAAKNAIDDGPLLGVITDLMLPDGDGFDVVAHARSYAANIPVLLVTGSLDPDVAARAFALDITFLPKPVVPDNLTSFARRCLAPRSRGLAQVQKCGDEWQARYHLTPTERELLVATAQGATRDELIASRGIAETTLKRHVTNLLEKTGEDSLDRAALRFLREVLRDI